MPDHDTRAKVFSIIAMIPRGKVTSYARVARLAGVKNPRQIGQILHTNTAPELYPCHRVIRSDGTVASGYAFGERDGQIKRLTAEGVLFEGNRLKDAAQFWWSPAE